MNPDHEHAQKIHQDATLIDLHAHPSMKTLLFRQSLSRRAWMPARWSGAMNPLLLRTSFANLQKGHVDILLSTVYAPEKKLFQDVSVFGMPLKWMRFLPFSLIRRLWQEFIEPDYFTVTLHMLDSMELDVEKYNRKRKPDQREVRIVKSSQELKALLAQSGDRPVALIHSVEGGHSLEGAVGMRLLEKSWDDLEPHEQAELETEVLRNLETLAKRGVAYLTLAHFYPNKLIAPTFPYPEHLALSLVPKDRRNSLRDDLKLTEGLTPLGRKVIERMIELQMLIDVSHATPRARQEIYAIVGASGRKSAVLATHVGAYALNPEPYNLEDWEIKWLAQHEGVAGILFMTYWLMPHETAFGLNAIARHIEHLWRVGGPSVPAIGTDFDGADPPDDILDPTELIRLTRRLLGEYETVAETKYEDQEVKAILGGNALRTLLNGWKGVD